jgi:hypothetical protein
MSDDITQQSPLDERYGLVGVRDLAEYAEALTRLLERGRRERCAAVLSEAEAVVQNRTAHRGHVRRRSPGTKARPIPSSVSGVRNALSERLAHADRHDRTAGQRYLPRPTGGGRQRSEAGPGQARPAAGHLRSRSGGFSDAAFVHPDLPPRMRRTASNGHPVT